MSIAKGIGMDVQRPNFKRKRIVRRILFSVLVIGLATGITYALLRLEPAAPTVDLRSVLIGTVKRGLFLREVRGIGTLTPDEEVWITASIDGLIKSIPVKPGKQVTTHTLLMEMQNPSLEMDSLETRWNLKSAEVELAALEVESKNNLLAMQADLAELEDSYKVTQLENNGNQELAEKGFLPAVRMDLTKLKLDSISRKIKVKQESLARTRESEEGRLAVAKGKVTQAQAMVDYKQAQMKLLQVRAGMNGVLVEISKEIGVGKRVAMGGVLAKVIDPTRLKAELKISEQQARELVLGLPVRLEVLSQTVNGKVARINPAVVEGNVVVDVTLEDTLPQGARPDLSLTGVIEIERVNDVVYVDRPVSATPNASSQLFKVIEAEQIAVRAPVEYGRSSAMTIEVLRGLEPGDQVIISDMSRWENEDKLCLE
jgi:HlyD family secretion protein